MKKQLLLAMSIMVLTIASIAQVPQGFNYQALIRNAEGEPLPEQAVSVRLTLQNEDGTIDHYAETHVVTTSPQGLINLTVGGGTPITGAFADIPWLEGSIYLKLEVDPAGGTSFSSMGTTQLQAVPYALYALGGEPGADGVGITSITDNGDGTFTINLSNGTNYTTSDLTGPQGPAGTGLNNRGAWVDGSTYEPNDYVFHRSVNDPDINSMWIAQVEEAFTSSTPPYLDPENWVEFQAPQGETGVGVQSTVDNNDGTFTINYTDGSSFTTANLTGPQGESGVGIQSTEDNGDGTFTINYTDGSTFTTSNLTGPAGADGMAIAGIEGQTLRHDGTDWVASDNIYNADANVGIGNVTPSEKLEVAGNIKAQGRLIGQAVEVNQPLPEEEPIFVVRNSAGQIVFAVYEGGVRAYVDDTSKQTRGGFAIGGLSDQTKEETGIHYFSLTPDSVRFNIKAPTLKQTRGGFAIGGLSDQTKLINQDLFYISPDSARIYIDTTSSSKQTRGGFAIGGLSDQTKGSPLEFLRITPDSTRIYFNNSTVTKQTRGGFAIGGLSDQTKSVVNNLFFVAKDSTRIYIDDTPSKQTRGGFAIGGLSDQTKAGQASFFNVYPDASGILESQPRILWYPLKNAFIAGQVKIDDPVDVGENSMSMGYETRASGGWSQALGYKSQAMGDYSTAIGREAIAEFENSFAFGQFAQAKNSESYALGRGAIAQGLRSYAFGSAGIDSIGQTTGNSYAIGDYSFAIGQGSISEGIGSFAVGIADTARGDFSIAMGYKTRSSSWYTTSMGAYSQADGDFATAIGFDNKALEVASTAMGYKTIAEGKYTFAAGANTIAKGYSSFASGYSTQANGNYSVALGWSNVATGQASFAVGRLNTSSGLYSMAFGYNNESGGYSLAGGSGCTAISSYSVALGLNSHSSSSYSLAIGRSNTASALHAVALGRSTTASADNAMSVGYGTFATGEYTFAAGYGTTAQAHYSAVFGRYNVVEGTSTGTGFELTEPLFVVGNGSAGIPHNALTLYKNGNMTIGGALTQNSDIRLKKNIVNMENALPNVLKINPVYYEFKNKEIYPAGIHIGFIAQDIQKYYPELVLEGSDGVLSIDYSRMTVVLLQAFKEQHKLIEKQQAENDELKAQIEEINKKLEILLNK